MSFPALSAVPNVVSLPRGGAPSNIVPFPRGATGSPPAPNVVPLRGAPLQVAPRPFNPNWSLPPLKGAPAAAPAAAAGTGSAAVGAAAVGAAAVGVGLGEAGRRSLVGAGFDDFAYPPNTGELLRNPVSTARDGVLGTISGLQDAFSPDGLATVPPPVPLPIPGKGSPPFTGGQSPGVLYEGEFTYNTHSSTNPQAVSRNGYRWQLVGPISGVSYGVENDFGPRQAAIRYGAGQAVTILNFNSSQIWVSGVQLTNIRRVDGQPDTGGDPAPSPSQDPPALPPYSPSPNTPAFSPAPLPGITPAAVPNPGVPRVPGSVPGSAPEPAQTPGLPSSPVQPSTPGAPLVPGVPVQPSTPGAPSPVSPPSPATVPGITPVPSPGIPTYPAPAISPSSVPASAPSSLPVAPGVSANPSASGEIVAPPSPQNDPSESTPRKKEKCDDACTDGILGLLSSLADLVSSIIDALNGEDQDCDICGLLEQAIALLETEDSNTLKLLPCDVEPGSEQAEQIPGYAWEGKGMQALLQSNKVTQSALGTIWDALKCLEQDSPVVIYPSDVYSEFVLESRLLLEFTPVDDFPKRTNTSSKWSLEIPNPRADLNWCADFENFRFFKGQWYGRCMWTDSGVKSGAYCRDEAEARKLVALIQGISTAQAKRVRVSDSGRADMFQGEVRVIRAVLSTIENGVVTNCVKFTPAQC